MKEIWLKGEFNQNTIYQLRMDILDHAALGADVPIVIYINSYGGQVDSLNSILDTLDSLPNKIVTVCSGTAMSCGAVLLAYGDERYIGSNSRVMIHQVSSMAWGTNNEIIATARETNKLNNQLGRILAQRTGKSLEEIKDLYTDNLDKYFSAKEAKKFGIVDKIGTPRLVKKTTYELV